MFERFRVQRFHVFIAISRGMRDPVGFSVRPSRPGPTPPRPTNPGCCRVKEERIYRMFTVTRWCAKREMKVLGREIGVRDADVIDSGAGLHGFAITCWAC